MSKDRTPRPFDAPAKKAPQFGGNMRSNLTSHQYKCSEGRKAAYLRYLSEGRRAKNKARNIARAAQKAAADAVKIMRTPRGTWRMIRRSVHFTTTPD